MIERYLSYCLACWHDEHAQCEPLIARGGRMIKCMCLARQHRKLAAEGTAEAPAWTGKLGWNEPGAERHSKREPGAD
jgi:hypothetical protein